jgi:hypothetical protein
MGHLSRADARQRGATPLGGAALRTPPEGRAREVGHSGRECRVRHPRAGLPLPTAHQRAASGAVQLGPTRAGGGQLAAVLAHATRSSGTPRGHYCARADHPPELTGCHPVLAHPTGPELDGHGAPVTLS